MLYQPRWLLRLTSWSGQDKRLSIPTYILPYQVTKPGPQAPRDRRREPVRAPRISATALPSELAGANLANRTGTGVSDGHQRDVSRLPGLPRPDRRGPVRAPGRGGVPVRDAVHRRAAGERQDPVPARALLQRPARVDALGQGPAAQPR